MARTYRRKDVSVNPFPKWNDEESMKFFGINAERLEKRFWADSGHMKEYWIAPNGRTVYSRHKPHRFRPEYRNRREAEMAMDADIAEHDNTEHFLG